MALRYIIVCTVFFMIIFVLGYMMDWLDEPLDDEDYS